MCAFQDDSAVVGIVSMGPPLEPAVDLSADEDPQSVGQLYQIHVTPSSWSQGVGTRLHAAFVGYLAETRRRTGLLEAWDRNERAQGFYARHGWRPDGRRRPGFDGSYYLNLRLQMPHLGS
jgi:ribosomal protein S18 acetylase RimI-like enzyme